MVEPFATVVFNKLLPFRSSSSSSSSLIYVARVISNSPLPSRKSIEPDFFSPQPRRITTGKQKDAFHVDVHIQQQLLQCREWSSLYRNLCCSLHARSVMTCELVRDDERLALRHFKKRSQLSPRYLYHRPPTSPFFSRLHSGQKRHNSGRSTEDPAQKPKKLHPEDTARNLWTEHEKRIHRLEGVMQTPRKDFDMGFAWRTFYAAEREPGLLPMTSRVGFVDKYVSSAELRFSNGDVKTLKGELKEWSTCAKEALERTRKLIAPRTRHDQWRLCLLARAYALGGEHDEALASLRQAEAIPMLDQHKAGVPYAYEMILASTRRYQGLDAAIGFLVREWEHIGVYLDADVNPSTQKSSLGRASNSLGRAASRVVSELQDPMKVLTRAGWKTDTRSSFGGFMIYSLCFNHLERLAVNVYSKMKELGLEVAPHRLRLLVDRLCMHASTSHLALQLFKALPEEHSVRYFRLGLRVFARKGDVDAVEGYFTRLSEVCSPNSEDKATVVNAYANMSDPRGADATFEKFFPLDEQGGRTNSPTVKHYSAVLHAHARADDREGIMVWLKDMAQASLVPDIHIYTIVLNAYAAAGDLDNSMAVLQQMKDAGFQPNAVTYTIMISLLAHRKDPLGAEILFKRALKDGIKVDNRMIVTMMNAHVEAGSWHGVIKIYDYLAAAGAHTLSLEVYNTLMKAYVLIGAPFSSVHRLFRRLERSRMQPDRYSYSLLVQSACDAGLMSTASDIYYDMTELGVDHPQRDLEINIYILTILMAGFLRSNDKVKAKGVYDEIRDLGIQPTPITFSTIIKAYGNERSGASLKIAEDFIKTLIAVPEKERVWKKPKYTPKNALHFLYGPVLASYARMQKPEEVDRVFQEMLESGAPPSLGTLSAVLDVHRRTGNVEGVLEIWPQIYELGMEMSKRDWLLPSDEVNENIRGMRNNVLCVPLSIYVDALSAVGYDKEVANTWKDIRAHGFIFDSHNWNHLAAAMCRFGEPERGFEIIEKVILPYQELSTQRYKVRNRDVTSALVFDAQEEPEDDKGIQGPPAIHSAIKRRPRARVIRRNVSSIQGWEDFTDDMAHQLQILHQVSPSWSVWKAHSATARVLLIALNHLSSGHLVKSVRQNAELEQHPSDDERLMARRVLNKIYSDYPKAVNIILNFEVMERQRLGIKYDEVYNWG